MPVPSKINVFKTYSAKPGDVRELCGQTTRIADPDPVVLTGPDLALLDQTAPADLDRHG